jgi:hypothetical protein
MLTAKQAKFDAEVKRRFDEVWRSLEEEIVKAVCKGKKNFVFFHEGLSDPKIKDKLINDLSNEFYGYAVYDAALCNSVTIYWDND